MTTIHRRTPDRDLLATYVSTTNGYLQGSLAVLENRPKTRLLLTRRFWTTAFFTLVIVVVSASYSVYQLAVVQSNNQSALRRLNVMNATASELLSGSLAVNSILTNVRFTDVAVPKKQIEAVSASIDEDLAKLEDLASNEPDPEIKLIVESISMTIGSWEAVLVDLSKPTADSTSEAAELELVGSAARSIELLQSKLNSRIKALEDGVSSGSRRAVLFGVGSLLFAIGGTVLLVPIAVAGSIERLVVLQKSNREREQRLGRATSSFLDNVNLELRTPLTSISGFAEVLSNDDGSINSAQQHRMIKTIYRNSQKMNELVDNVLTMCKIQTGEIRFKFTEFDARDVLRAEVERRQELARISGIELVVKEPSEPIPMVGDFEEISRTVRAVLDNAITYSKRDGIVEISVRREDDVVEGPMAVFVVTDQGIGIPSEEMSDVLDAFERASNAVSLSIAGAGLGLSIVDFIVFEHGGEWKISSVENEGTEVEICFPCLRNDHKKPDNSLPLKEKT